MTSAQSRTLARIDHERRAAAAGLRQSLRRARVDDLAETIERPAMLARLVGIKRTLLDASAFIGRDARSAHYLLSREDDERRKKEGDRLLWLLAFLGLPDATVYRMQYDAGTVAQNAADALRGVAQNAAANAQHQSGLGGGAAGVRRVQGVAVGTVPPASRLYEPGMVRPAAAGTKSETVSHLPDVFGRFGRPDVHLIPQAAIDTWAETVAYTQYERGRYEARNVFPAVAEALWGYRWSSVLDSRTTVGCRELDGWVAPVEDTRMSALSPPRHFSCRAVLVPVWQSSRLKRPVAMREPSDATFGRLLAQKESFLVHLN